MTLRQFTSVSELINKLRADLRLAFPRLVVVYIVRLLFILYETYTFFTNITSQKNFTM